MGSIGTSPGCNCCGGTSCKANFRVLKCCTIPVNGATVTATLGLFSVSGTTDSFGNVTLDIAGGGPGSYTVTATHDGLTSTTTAELSCGSSLVLDGGCTISMFVADCCGNSIVGAVCTVKDSLGNTVGSCTVTTTGPVGLTPGCFVNIPQAGTYTVECGAAGIVNTPQTITTGCAGGAVHFAQDQSLPTSLTDPSGNAIALTGGKGTQLYTVDLTALPTYPGTFPPCEFTPSVLVRTPDVCSAPSPYTTSAQVTLGFVLTKCGMTIIAPTCRFPNGNPFGLLADTDPGTTPSGGPSEVSIDLMGSGQCDPYVGQADLTFAPGVAQVQNYCNDPVDINPILWLLTAIFGDSGSFTAT